MKKLLTVIIVVVCGVLCFFGYNYISEKNITDSSKWVEFDNSEFTVTLPENMKSSSKLYTVSTGQEQIAFYENSDSCFSVAKLPYSQNEALKNIDIKDYFKNLQINGQSITMFPVNDGYYYSRQVNSSGIFDNTSDIFVIEGVFKGETAVYSVVIQCRLSDKDTYEDSMLKWLESFKLK